jgi:hypothetical protein
MTDLTFGSHADPLDHDGPATCAACGCRLQAVGPVDATVFVHFGALGGKDARGCRVACAELTHDWTGRPIPGAAVA